MADASEAAPVRWHGEVLAVRVYPQGWRRWFHPTIAEVGDAVTESVLEACRWPFVSIERAQMFVAARVRARLNVNIRVALAAHDADTRDALFEVHTDHVGPVHFVMRMADPAPPPAPAGQQTS